MSDAAFAIEMREPSAKYLVEIEPTFVRGFELLSSAQGGLDRLKNLVLRWALLGKLLPQLPSDDPAGPLLKVAREITARRLAEGHGKREKPAEPVAADEQSFTLPSGWVWCRVTDTGQYINGLAFKPADWGSKGRPIIRIQNLSGRNSHFNRTTKSVDSSVIVNDGEVVFQLCLLIIKHRHRIHSDSRIVR